MSRPGRARAAHRRGSALLVLIATSLLVEAAAAQSASAPSVSAPEGDFVRVEDGHFAVGGTRLRTLGANVAVMHGEAHRQALDETLDAVQADGLGLVRLWALGERDEDAPEWARSYAFRIGAEGWVEESFTHLDRALAAVRARGLRAIVVLGNRWADYGGIPAYLRWTGDPFDASSPDGIARAELGTFFGSSRARALYLAHVERVVGRTSTVTGLPYRDDPSIFAWELVNELSCERRDRAALVDFVRTAAARVHALDRHHLVSAGHIGYDTSADRRTWREVMSLPEIDYADAHAYPAEHGRVTSLRELDAFVDDHAMLARTVLGKPLVLGEIGFRTRTRSFGLTRAQLFAHLLDRARRDDVDAALAWIYCSGTDPCGTHTIDVSARRGEASEVRRVLATHAASMRTAPSEPPVWASGTTPLWDPSHEIAGTRRVAAARGDRISIAPEDFARARFEHVGRYDEGAVRQLYGAGHGWVEYRFRAPRGIPSTLTLTMRASSELPGAGVGAGPGDGSHVYVTIDGEGLGLVEVPPDDGLGRRVSLSVPVDDALAAVFRARTVHTLRLEVADEDDEHGLCLYGEATSVGGPLPAEVAAELPGRIELVLGAAASPPFRP